MLSLFNPATLVDAINTVIKCNIRIQSCKSPVNLFFALFSAPAFVLMNIDSVSMSSSPFQAAIMPVFVFYKLTSQQKQHKLTNGLCLYCGGVKYITIFCSKKPNNLHNKRGEIYSFVWCLNVIILFISFLLSLLLVNSFTLINFSVDILCINRNLTWSL